MKKTLAALTAAALVAGSAMSGSAVARDRDNRSDRWERSERGDRNELTANQIIDRFAARTARIKADLRLTPEQDTHWAGFANAMNDMAKKVADRRTARRDEIARQRDAAREAEARQSDAKPGDVKPGDAPNEDARKDDRRNDRRARASDNFLERMRQEAAVMSEMAADRKTIADAAQPLFDSLDDRQRQRFAEAISNMNRRPDRD